MPVGIMPAVFIFSVMIKLTVTWKDERLEFRNLRDDIYRNRLTNDEEKAVWIPEIGMLGQWKFEIMLKWQDITNKINPTVMLVIGI